MINRIELSKVFDSTNVLVSLSAGHGGVFSERYWTAPNKMKRFYNEAGQTEFTFYEGVFNRQIVLRIISYLHNWGISYSFTNFTHNDIHPRKRGKQTDIDLANSGLPYGFGIEIHANYFSKESVRGFEIYTSKGITKSDRIASTIYEQVKSDNLMPMRSGYSKVDPDVDKEENFAYLIGGIQPLVLVEVDFFSNEDVAKSLMDPIRQDKIAHSISKAIKKSIENEEYI
ncbi:MAG: N-acetylmuramoyl-L-alanine amidase [Candidatus Marinimicrobia bacterium]|nr:N-acetylmuramoyl-L-alanine amidase [Candidatus Neomarinimicrobiota bacterium]